MWVVNNSKERVKIYLRSDIESSITNLTNSSNQIQSLTAALDCVVAGSLARRNLQMLDDCKKALLELSTALQNLYVCRNLVNQLNTKEWVDDEQH